MAYNFKSLADVELLNSMPENANVIIEVDGATRRVPIATETLTEMPESATVLVEIDGKIKRIHNSKLIGDSGSNELLICGFEDGSLTASISYEDAVNTIADGTLGTVIYKEIQSSCGKIYQYMAWEIQHLSDYNNGTIRIKVNLSADDVLTIDWSSDGTLEYYSPAEPV